MSAHTLDWAGMLGCDWYGRRLWDDVMAMHLKHFGGLLRSIARVPQDFKQLCAIDDPGCEACQ